MAMKPLTCREKRINQLSVQQHSLLAVPLFNMTNLQNTLSGLSRRQVPSCLQLPFIAT